LNVLLKIAHFIDQLTEYFGAIANWLVILVIGVGFFNVVARYVGRFIGISLSSNVYIELQWYIFSLIFFLGFSYILKHNVNVRVDFLYTNWSLKRQALVDFWGTVLFLIPFCIMGIYVTINPVLISWGRRPNGTWGTWEMSPDPSGLPRAPIKTMIIVAFVMLLAQAIAQAIKYLAIIRGHTEIVQEIKAESEAGLPIE
jgi:TRAP-type mannitol/chloroaromatic compound transport system permease small subunit